MKHRIKMMWIVELQIKAISNSLQIRAFNGIENKYLCFNNAGPYQMSYEEPHIGRRPICWAGDKNMRKYRLNKDIIWSSQL